MPLLLSPLSALYGAATARRVARAGWKAPVPVLCCGNVTAGGSGKTPVALSLGRHLAARGIAVHFLLRGYGGSEKGPLLVDASRHDSRQVGDEALLLAAERPTWVAANREAGARAAIAAGAELLVMDDGLQNPQLVKDISLLVVDGGFGFGNGRIIPAGPLREPVAAAAGRCAAVVLLGEDTAGVQAALAAAGASALPVLRARMVQGPEATLLAGTPVYAFCGIGQPRKFFNSLQESGVVLAGRQAYADHYPYDAGDLRDILAEAERLRAVPVTTRKDYVRIPQAFRAQITAVGVGLEWEDTAALDAVLAPLGASPLDVPTTVPA